MKIYTIRMFIYDSYTGGSYETISAHKTKEGREEKFAALLKAHGVVAEGDVVPGSAGFSLHRGEMNLYD